MLRQSPAGERIHLRSLIAPLSRADASTTPTVQWQPFGSGTMALAAAMQFARLRTAGSQQVLVPAYSCPDIVAAAQFAGLEPVFLDLAPGQTAPSQKSVADAIRGGGCIALLVDLFGTRQDTLEIAAAARDCGAWIIRDQAQCHAGPGADADPGDADLVVVSRGRGKPASMLKGGAAWARDVASFATFVEENYCLKSWSTLGTALRAAAYNLALSPPIYAGIARLPFLRVGETRLRALTNIYRLPATWTMRAASQLREQGRNLDERRRRTLELCDIAVRSGLTLPTDIEPAASSMGLNRLPVICRDFGQTRYLCAMGAEVGISGMYGRALPEFLGASEASVAESLPNAYRVARTLVTLPTHSRMSGRSMARLKSILSDFH